MSYSFNNEKPIYMQIMEQIIILIISKKYLPGQKIPSVREYSLIFEVNPNTMQKALSELEDMNLIQTERTNGKFVTNDTDLIEKVKNDFINDKINRFFTSMEEIGLKREDIKNYILNGGIKND